MTPSPRSRFSLYLDLIRWNRPAGWLVLIWPTLSALWVAAGGFPGWHLLAVFVLGTILMRSAGCCINDVADRDFDRHVKRTAQRPVTSGAVSVKEALAVGAALALLALEWWVNDRIQPGALADQGFDHGGLVFPGGKDEQGVAVGVGGVHVHALLHPLGDGGGIAQLGGGEQVIQRCLVTGDNQVLRFKFTF